MFIAAELDRGRRWSRTLERDLFPYGDYRACAFDQLKTRGVHVKTSPNEPLTMQAGALYKLAINRQAKELKVRGEARGDRDDEGRETDRERQRQKQ